MGQRQRTEISENFRPIRLVATNVISRKGYFDCEITGFERRDCGGRPLLVIKFVVTKGRCSGFELSSGFYYEEMKGKVRFTHLCNAVGITDKLRDPNVLVGKRLRVRVVPKTVERNGRKFRNLVITRFHELR
ncbi:hypothetical protein TRIP_B350084 [uncultured Desulfatiglans sp.]|uniref:Uncharacterized protein n=1 Tax=Uncultured Desulfatiglans sp. TaxID=1748965 RepID=A0A653AAB4_UNCDX|nr:hypothetical protein TRIP_B350084 [uncultured Desulfatiglans sp.]